MGGTYRTRSLYASDNYPEVTTMDSDALPPGWALWNLEERESLILAFRPDVFDGEAFPSACLPTIYVREGEKDLRNAGREPVVGTEGSWTVRLFLEPDVSTGPSTHAAWDAAVDEAVSLAESFAAGEVDLRAIYQLPREDYLERLEQLTLGDGSR